MQFRTSSLSTPCQTCGCADTSCKDCQTPDNCSNCASCCCDVTHQSWRLARFRNGITIEYISSIWMTIGNRVSHRGSYRDALSLPGEEKDRQRHQDTFSLYRRHRIVNLHLHGPSSTRRPPRRIFLPTLVGRLSGHRSHTRLRSKRSS